MYAETRIFDSLFIEKFDQIIILFKQIYRVNLLVPIQMYVCKVIIIVFIV